MLASVNVASSRSLLSGAWFPLSGFHCPVHRRWRLNCANLCCLSAVCLHRISLAKAPYDSDHDSLMQGHKGLPRKTPKTGESKKRFTTDHSLRASTLVYPLDSQTSCIADLGLGEHLGSPSAFFDPNNDNTTLQVSRHTFAPKMLTGTCL